MSTIQELEGALVTARAEQAAAAERMAREARAAEQARKRAADRLATEVAQLEKELPRTLAAAEAAAKAEPPHSLGDRWNARRLLLGTLIAPDDIGELGMVGRADRAFAILAGGQSAAEQTVLRCERELGEADPLSVRAAAIECALHRAVQQRARQIGDGT